jgi:formylglycine-generating enzyme required for sulfatase activity
MADGQKLKVFISYSRKDSTDFADELVAGLELAGFAPFIDRHDIAVGEDWETRLGGLIHDADTVVYLISPEAMKSERCAWEVDKTLALSKRLIPVIFKPVADTAIPHSLSRLQFIRFDQGLGITRPLAQLAEALRQDLDWIREHTRLGELAARWQARGRPSSLLLRGDDVVSARTWAAKRKQEAPEITEAQTSFLNASIAESRIARRQRILVQVLIGALAAVIVLGVLAYWNDQVLKGLYHRFTLGRVLTAQNERMLKPGDTFSECIKTDGDYSKYCPQMVVVPAGKFTMGSPATEMSRGEYEGPQHEVRIVRAFAVSRFEVTFDQWDACMQYGGCMRVLTPFGAGKQPAINVSWDDAQEYVKWLSAFTGRRYRLLTEAEWEYAARAGSTGPYSFEGDALMLGEYAWYLENSGNKTHPVGEKKPNAFGLYDMHGNVGEWVEDCYHETYDGAPTDGSAWTTGNSTFRVFRGGSWLDSPWFGSLRSAHRARNTPDDGGDTLGFRVGRTLLPP